MTLFNGQTNSSATESKQVTYAFLKEKDRKIGECCSPGILQFVNVPVQSVMSPFKLYFLIMLRAFSKPVHSVLAQPALAFDSLSSFDRLVVPHIEQTSIKNLNNKF